jgi:hypothetical protein
VPEARGTFEVTITPLFEDEAPGKPGASFALEKTFAGGLVGSGSGRMLTAMTPVDGSAGYVAIEEFDGELDGRQGTFVLQHFGLMSDAGQEQRIEIVPDSGTGALTGIGGTLVIEIEDGEHRYVLSYR